MFSTHTMGNNPSPSLRGVYDEAIQVFVEELWIASIESRKDDYVEYRRAY